MPRLKTYTRKQILDALIHRPPQVKRGGRGGKLKSENINWLNKTHRVYISAPTGVVLMQSPHGEATRGAVNTAPWGCRPGMHARHCFFACLPAAEQFSFDFTSKKIRRAQFVFYFPSLFSRINKCVRSEKQFKVEMAERLF